LNCDVGIERKACHGGVTKSRVEGVIRGKGGSSSQGDGRFKKVTSSYGK
jgi:hypothetical protein